MNKGCFEQRNNRFSQLGISGLLQQGKLDDVSIPEMEVQPEAKTQVTPGQNEEHVTFVEASSSAKMKDLFLLLRGLSTSFQLRFQAEI